MSTVDHSTWSWNEAPFSTKSDPKRFFTAVAQEESLARLHFLVDNHRRLGILDGPAGSGKSMLLDVCARQFQQQGRQVVRLNLMGLDADEFLWRLAAGLGVNPRPAARPLELWRDIDDQLLANRYQRIDNVILCDNTEEAESDVLTLLGRLVQFDLNDDSRLSVVLSVESGRGHLLGRRLLELCDLRIELEAWSAEETAEFVRTTLTAAACSPELFSSEALHQLHELSQGIPRRIQQLAQLALIAADGQDLEQIDEQTLNAVQLELTARPDAWS